MLSIDKELLSKFNMNGKAKIRDWYFKNDSEPMFYSDGMFSKFIDDADSRRTKYYGDTDLWLYKALSKYSIDNKNVLICGSTTPWYESICISFGCKDITVLEYNARKCGNKYVKYIQNTDNSKYDVILSISSFEHDGLGRYGDNINPNGDIDAMHNIKNSLKENGVLILAVPIGEDQVVWNAHRVYGKHRLPLLIKGYNILDKYGYTDIKIDSLLPIKSSSSYQPIFVLENGK